MGYSLAVATKENIPQGPIKHWLEQVGATVKELRGKEKQDAFAKRVRISRAQLIIIEKGKRSYGIEPLLRILSGVTTEPAQVVSTLKLLPGNPRHKELHERLQRLLDADPPWPMAAEVNVDAVYELYRARAAGTKP